MLRTSRLLELERELRNPDNTGKDSLLVPAERGGEERGGESSDGASTEMALDFARRSGRGAFASSMTVAGASVGAVSSRG